MSNQIQREKQNACAVFQITFKGRVPIRSFEGSVHVGLPTPSQVYHLFCRVRWPALLGFGPETPLLSGTLLCMCQIPLVHLAT